MKSSIAETVVMILIALVSSMSSASAVCCFPWDVIYNVDPDTGFLIVSGELWNDSYSGEPFGEANYRFSFTDENNEILFERDILISDGHPIDGGFTIPPVAVFPFQFVIDDVEPEIIGKVAHVSTRGTNSLEYFGWKPADLSLNFDKLEEKENQSGKSFTKWQITGTITNTNAEKTGNVFVLASLYGEDQSLVGVAGYSDFDIQPQTLNGLETKKFALYANIPAEKIPVNVSPCQCFTVCRV